MNVTKITQTLHPPLSVFLYYIYKVIIGPDTRMQESKPDRWCGIIYVYNFQFCLQGTQFQTRLCEVANLGNVSDMERRECDYF